MVVMGGDDKNKNNKVGIGMRGFFGEIFRADQFGQKGP
jgi:dTDP-4-dehydrorhamnose 3,5-epimerase-like enzyme